MLTIITKQLIEMEIKNGIFYLGESKSCTPYQESIIYTDKDNNKVNIPYSLLFGLYELVKFDTERRGIDISKYKSK
jgi:hypothetical protein